MSTPTKVFPREGFYVAGVPHVVHEFPTKTAATEFAEAHPQAFSLDEADAMDGALDGAENGFALPELTPAQAPEEAPISQPASGNEAAAEGGAPGTAGEGA